MRSLSEPKQWPPKRTELLNWFRVNAEPLAEAYEGAVRLLEEGSFPGRVHFIAHVVRDIADRLPYVLDPQLKGHRIQYENVMDEIEKLWPRLRTVKEATNRPVAEEKVAIDYILASKIDSLVKAHRERREQPSSSELLFQFLMRQEPSHVEVNRRLVSDFKKMRDWFMQITHLRRDRSLEVDENELQSQFRSFEAMLHSFVGNFFTGIAELDEILQQANRRAT
jgi:hypothetical protein